jgi:hypothetical protein
MYYETFSVAITRALLLFTFQNAWNQMWVSDVLFIGQEWFLKIVWFRFIANFKSAEVCLKQFTVFNSFTFEL